MFYIIFHCTLRCYKIRYEIELIKNIQVRAKLIIILYVYMCVYIMKFLFF